MGRIRAVAEVAQGAHSTTGSVGLPVAGAAAFNIVPVVSVAQHTSRQAREAASSQEVIVGGCAGSQAAVNVPARDALRVQGWHVPAPQGGANQQQIDDFAAKSVWAMQVLAAEERGAAARQHELDAQKISALEARVRELEEGNRATSASGAGAATMRDCVGAEKEQEAGSAQSAHAVLGTAKDALLVRINRVKGTLTFAQAAPPLASGNDAGDMGRRQDAGGSSDWAGDADGKCGPDYRAKAV